MISILAIANVPNEQLKPIQELIGPYGLDICIDSEYRNGQTNVAVVKMCDDGFWHISKIEF